MRWNAWVALAPIAVVLMLTQLQLTKPADASAGRENCRTTAECARWAAESAAAANAALRQARQANAEMEARFEQKLRRLGAEHANRAVKHTWNALSGGRRHGETAVAACPDGEVASAVEVQWGHDEKLGRLVLYCEKLHR